ncbi:MAG: single-stranded DNA-binding protein [Patescibacteria group bacterium]
MADLNEVRLIGRLTRDPELRTTPGGASICTFGLATNRKYKANDGKITDETTFVDITCWGKVAENVSKYMKKGRLIYVGGRLKFESWDDKQTGQKRNKLSVVAESVQFLDFGDKQSATAGQPAASSETPPPPNAWSGDPYLGEPPF